MPKKIRIGTLMDSQYVKGFETLHKSARQYFWITLKENQLEKTCFSSVWNPETLC